MTLGNSNGLSSLAIGRRRGDPAPHKGPADLTVALHIIETFRSPERLKVVVGETKQP